MISLFIRRISVREFPGSTRRYTHVRDYLREKYVSFTFEIISRPGQNDNAFIKVVSIDAEFSPENRRKTVWFLFFSPRST